MITLSERRRTLCDQCAGKDAGERGSGRDEFVGGQEGHQELSCGREGKDRKGGGSVVGGRLVEVGGCGCGEK